MVDLFVDSSATEYSCAWTDSVGGSQITYTNVSGSTTLYVRSTRGDFEEGVSNGDRLKVWYVTRGGNVGSDTLRNPIENNGLYYYPFVVPDIDVSCTALVDANSGGGDN